MKNSNVEEKQIQELYAAFAKIKNEEEAAAFCRDLMTIGEIREFAKRWQIAKLLNTKKMSYEQIAKEVQTSTTTVTRVNEWLENGMNGYKTILQRIWKNKPVKTKKYQIIDFQPQTR